MDFSNHAQQRLDERFGILNKDSLKEIARKIGDVSIYELIRCSPDGSEVRKIRYKKKDIYCAVGCNRVKTVMKKRICKNHEASMIQELRLLNEGLIIRIHSMENTVYEMTKNNHFMKI